MPSLCVNTLRPRQNGRHFADDIFKCIFLNENVWISIKMSLKFVPNGPIINIPALVQIMAWRRPGDKPLSEPMMVSLMTRICVTQPQWVNWVTATHWLSRSPRFLLRVPDLQMCWRDLTAGQVARIVSKAMEAGRHAPFYGHWYDAVTF